MLEALHDLLSAGGDIAVAERMELITENALANLFAKNGVFPKQAVNREGERADLRIRIAVPRGRQRAFARDDRGAPLHMDGEGRVRACDGCCLTTAPALPG